MSHTKGPWAVSQLGRRNDGSIAVMTDSDVDRFAVAYVNVSSPQPRGKAHLAQDDASESNARLIAAAPDMLDALRIAAEALDNYSDVNDGGNGPVPNRAMAALQDVEAAIAKAEGHS